MASSEQWTERIAKALAELAGDGEPGWTESSWDTSDDADKDEVRDYARRFLLPLVCEAQKEALEEAADALVSELTSYGMEMRHDGTEDPGMAAYVEGIHAAYDLVRGRAQQLEEETHE